MKEKNKDKRQVKLQHLKLLNIIQKIHVIKVIRIEIA